MYIMIFLASVFIASISQVLLKKSAMKQYDYKFGDYLNLYVICGYGLLFLSMFLTILAYRGVDLKTGPVIEATSYIYVAVLSAIFLKERITKKKTIGLLVIVIGILVSNL
ncbi:MAG: EamA family transporter [Roseburia sp.]|nr:EamA family transporter [Roseburia sp.]MCM1278075.1 EamA family transporter [Robinsoniella sp.]